MILRLVLGDQLNYEHSWYQETTDDVCYFMAEMRQETDYTIHHIQKVVAFFLSMRNFSNWLQSKGFETEYYEILDSRNQQELVLNLQQIILEKKITKFEYQLPDEFRLDQQLSAFCNTLNIPFQVYDTEHFLAERYEVSNFFEGKKQYVMEYFYRYMRKKYDILMISDKAPEGGKWNFDQSNRKKWKGDHLIPPEKIFSKNVENVTAEIEKAGIKTMGNIDKRHFPWPVNRKESLELLTYFKEQLLSHFGDYQDAMHTDHR